MSDLIGLKKYSKPSEAEDSGGGQAPAGAPSQKSFGSQGLWMGLLVVDSLLIAVFGSYLGVVGMKAYHQWRGKAPIVTAPTKSPLKPEPAKAVAPAPPAAETPKEAAPEPAKQTAKALEPAKAAKAHPEPAKKPAAPEPAKAQAKPAKEPPSPSMGSAKAPAPDAADALVKALPVEFSYHAPSAKSVKLAGAFLVRGGGKKDMVHGSGGDWNLTLYLKPGSYRYWFLEDGKRKVDPRNSKVERGASVVVIYPK
ncbi:MAG: hypothetical protein HY924_05720 [Elusimicrobia bacterium]|nr:hypothetical protein [Elusimicrobiota bacterium]